MKSYSFYHNVAKEELHRNLWSYVKAQLLMYGIVIAACIPVAILFVLLFMHLGITKDSTVYYALAALLALPVAFFAFIPLCYAFSNTCLARLRQNEESPLDLMMSIFTKEWGRATLSGLLVGVLEIAIIITCLIASIVAVAVITVYCFGFGIDEIQNLQNNLSFELAFVPTLAIGCIPFFIFVLAVFQTDYIVHDNPKNGIWNCMRKSIHLMNGHKFQLFALILTFIGWLFLSLGLDIAEEICETKDFHIALFVLYSIDFIYTLWLTPYMGLVFAAYYKDLISEQTEENKDSIESAENTL